MNKPKFENEVARIFIDTKVKLIRIEWITAPTSPEFREVMSRVLALLTENKFTRLIGDVRHLGAVAEEDQHWSNATWFPEALESGINKIGIIVSDDIFSQLSVEEIMSRVDNAELSSHYFSSPEEAMSWIK